MIDNKKQFDLSGVRSLDIKGETWFCLTDVVTAVGGDADNPALMDAFIGAPVEHRSVRTLYGTDGTAAELPVVTHAGMAHVLLGSSSATLREFAFSLLVPALGSVLLAQTQALRRSVRPVTQWGEQPARQVLKSMGVSVAELAVLLGSVPGRPGMVFKVSTMNAVLFGRQLPSPEFLSRAQYVFQRPVEALFTAQALAAFEGRYGELRQVTGPDPSVPGGRGGRVPASAPVVPVVPPRVVPLLTEPATSLEPPFEPPFSILSEEELDAASLAVSPPDDDDAPIDPSSLGLSEAELDVVYGEAFSAGFSLTDPPVSDSSSS